MRIGGTSVLYPLASRLRPRASFIDTPRRARVAWAGRNLLGKTISIRPDGSILLAKELVEEVFGKAREAIVHLRTGYLVLSPIYVDMESGQVPQLLAQYHQFQDLETVIDKYFQRLATETVQFEGDLSVLALSDVFLFLSASKKSGVLLLHEKYRWGFFLQNGNLVFATSEDPKSSLAAYLLRRQFLTEQDLLEGSRFLEEQEDTLKVLFQLTGLSPQALNEQWVRSVEEMIFQVFQLNKGRFSFLNGELTPPFVLGLPMTTTNYVMEATRRLDEWARVQDKVPPDAAILQLAEDVTASTKLSYEEEQVLSQITGQRSVQEIIAKAKVGEMDGKKALASLIAAGLVKVQKAEPAPAPSAAPELPEEERRLLLARLDSYNAVFSAIYQALSMEAGTKVDVIMGAFFKGLEPKSSLLAGMGFTPEGILPPEGILDRLAGVEGNRLEALVRDLNELLYFQLFAVKNTLGPEMEAGIVDMAKSLLHS